MSRYNDRSRDSRRVSLLVRNLPLDARAEEIRAKFERFGDIRDVYLPKDYYTGRARGFGFIEFRDTRDAEDALSAMDGKVVGGREISVVLSKEARKTPRDMARRPSRRRSPSRDRHRSPRRRSRSRSRGRRSVSRSYSRSKSRSASRSRSRSRSRDARSPPSRGRSPRNASRSPSRE